MKNHVHNEFAMDNELSGQSILQITFSIVASFGRGDARKECRLCGSEAYSWRLTRFLFARMHRRVPNTGAERNHREGSILTLSQEFEGANSDTRCAKQHRTGRESNDDTGCIRERERRISFRSHLSIQDGGVTKAFCCDIGEACQASYGALSET